MKRGAPPRRESDRHRAQTAARTAVLEIVRRRDRYCIAAELVPEVRCDGPLDGDELISRAHWRDGYLDPMNTILVCRAHHTFRHDNPTEAEARGLRVPGRYATDPTEGLAIAAAKRDALRPDRSTLPRLSDL